MALAEFGQEVGTDGNKACLDVGLNNDQYVDLGDLLAWDAILNSPFLDICRPNQNLGFRSLPPALVTLPPDVAVVIAGKSNQAGVLEDFLYPLDVDSACLGPQLSPPAGANTRSNTRLIRDGQGKLYQIHAGLGLLSFNDTNAVLSAGEGFDPDFPDNQVFVGVIDQNDGTVIGSPLLDVTFDPTDATNTTVFVLPVTVFPATTGNPPYNAAAKLKLEPGGTFTVLKVYGKDPCTQPEGSNITACTNGLNDVVYEPDMQRLRDIKADASRQIVFVLAAQAVGAND